MNTNVWGKSTANDLIQDSKKALDVLVQQPEVDPKRISIIGHSDTTLYAPRVAIDNSTATKEGSSRIACEKEDKKEVKRVQ